MTEQQAVPSITTVEKQLHTVLSTVASQYSDEDRPGMVHYAPGAEVAWDNCCEGGGQLYLRLIGVHPSQTFPQPTLAPGCRAAMFDVHFAVGAIRCAHTVSSRGVPPSGEQMSSDFSVTLGDLTMIQQGLVEAASAAGILKLVLGRWSPRGPNGGCVAGEWDAHLAVNCLGWVPDALVDSGVGEGMGG